MPTPLRRVYENLRTGHAVLRDANRLGQIAVVLVRHGFGAFVQSLKLQDRWVTNKLFELAPQMEDLPIERRILLACQELGPTFIKLGQMLSTRPDVFPPALIQELQTLQDRVPPLALDAVREVIRAELGQSVEELFTDFDPQPLATASIAQVHSARLAASGEDVVVKVQRPDLEAQFVVDLEIMAVLARALETNFPETKMFSPSGMVAEFGKAILREIDFGLEVENLERFAVNFASDERVSFPKPYHEYCSTRVLTMQRIVGTKISEIGGRPDVEQIVRAALNAVLQMIYSDGFFHGDLHPGNIMVRADGSIVFIDVGLCGHLSPRERDVMTDLLIAVVGSDWEGLARLFWSIAERGRESTADFRKFEADVIESARRWFSGRTAAAIEFSVILKDLVGLSLKHRVHMPPSYTMTFKAVITMEGVGKQLCPDMDLLAAAAPYVTGVVAARYQPQRLIEGGYAALRDVIEVMRLVPDATRTVLDEMRAGRARITVEIPQLERLERSHASTQHRTILGVWAGVSALCGVLALDHDARTVFGLPALAVLFFVLAVAFALRYVAEGKRR